MAKISNVDARMFEARGGPQHAMAHARAQAAPWCAENRLAFTSFWPARAELKSPERQARPVLYGSAPVLVSRVGSGLTVCPESFR